MNCLYDCLFVFIIITLKINGRKQTQTLDTYKKT